MQSDVRKPSEVQKITQYCKLIGNTKSVSFKYHSFDDKHGDEKKYPAIMFIKQYTIAKEHLKDPSSDDVSFLKKILCMIFLENLSFFLDFILTYFFLSFQGIRYKTATFYVSQYPQLVEALEEIKQCNLDVNWPTINDQDRVPLKRYQGDSSFPKI